MANILRDRFQGNEQWKDPNLRDEAGDETLVGFLGNPSPPKQLNDKQDLSGNGEQIRLKRRKTQ